MKGTRRLLFEASGALVRRAVVLGSSWCASHAGEPVVSLRVSTGVESKPTAVLVLWSRYVSWSAAMGKGGGRLRLSRARVRVFRIVVDHG